MPVHEVEKVPQNSRPLLRQRRAPRGQRLVRRRGPRAPFRPAAIGNVADELAGRRFLTSSVAPASACTPPRRSASAWREEVGIPQLQARGASVKHCSSHYLTLDLRPMKKASSGSLSWD